jgi:hypothetical protein
MCSEPQLGSYHSLNARNIGAECAVFVSDLVCLLAGLSIHVSLGIVAVMNEPQLSMVIIPLQSKLYKFCS